MSGITRKIVGKTTIVTENVKKEIRTKNTLRQVIERVTHNAILLECGHAIDVTWFAKVPTLRTECSQCETDAKEGSPK